jgi:glyoxylase-like metal-dependent hydrolase (beta-lactamase superfamily II)
MRKNTWKKSLIFVCFVFVLTFVPVRSHSQQAPEFTIEKVSGNVYCLYGQGGNIGILKGEEALLLVDSQYARTAQSALSAIEELSPLKIQCLINTHYHGDHTSGNPVLGKDAEIISHENCRTSFLSNLKPEESPDSRGAPQKTFADEMTLQVADETLKLVHFGPGHTSGDTVVIFEKSMVIHAGDLFFHGMPPYIDVKDGSDTKNWVATIQKLGEKYPAFKIIPGHGRVTDMKSFLRFAEYLKYLRSAVAAAIKEGKTREQAQESVDLTKFSDIQDQGQFLTKKENIGWVYDEMTREKEGS